VLVVIHHNGSEDPLISGTEVYYDPGRGFGAQSRKLAVAIHDALIRRLQGLPYAVTDRGVKDDAPIGQRYGQPHTYLFGEAPGFRATTMPAALGEALFVSNDAEAALLQRDEVKQAIAEGYRDGIETYFRP
jgi:N-acetylmuramoyl-L-alanine amidase